LSGAREKLLAVHNQRMVDRTIIGGWFSTDAKDFRQLFKF